MWTYKLIQYIHISSQIYVDGRGGIWTHELKSQDLANLHNNHSVTRLNKKPQKKNHLILLNGIEPISSHSQYDILAY